MRNRFLLPFLAALVAVVGVLPAQYVERFDCGRAGWTPDGAGATMKHGRSAAPENGGLLEVRALGAGDTVFISRPGLNLNGSTFFEFAMEVEAPFLAPGEELPITAVAYSPGPTLTMFGGGIPPIVGPDRQILRAAFPGGFRQPTIVRLDLRFGGAADPLANTDVLQIDWVAVTNDPLFVPASQDTADCGAATFVTFDCSLEGWAGNPNLDAAWEDRSGGKAILTFPGNPPANAQFNPPTLPLSVDVTATPWMLVKQKVTGTGAPASRSSMLLNTVSQGAPGVPGWAESDPNIHIFLPAYFTGTVDITEIRFVQGAGPGVNWPATELEVDYIAFAAQEGAFPVQDTTPCPADYVQTFDCGIDGWVPDGTGVALKHGRSAAPENSGRMELRPTPGSGGTAVQVARQNIFVNGSQNFEFAMRVQAPFLAVGEELPITAVAYSPGPTLTMFGGGVPSIVGPDPQIVRAAFPGGFQQPEIFRLDLRFGGASDPVPDDGAVFVDWVSVTNDGVFEPAAQDTEDCGTGTFFTFDCDLNGWAANPNMTATWEDRSGGKAILTFPPTPANAQFNPPGLPYTVDVDATPWFLVEQAVTGTGAPASRIGMLINTANQGFANVPGWAESDPRVQVFLPAYFSGPTEITEIRFYQVGGTGVNFETTELEVDWIGFAETQGALPAAQDTEDCDPPVLTTVSIASDNANPAFAREGDTITVDIIADESMTAPTVTIAGTTATITGSGDTYSASVVLGAGSPEGVAAIEISGYEDGAGNVGGPVTATTDSSAVVIDTTAPETTLVPDSPLLVGTQVGFTYSVSDANGASGTQLMVKEPGAGAFGFAAATIDASTITTTATLSGLYEFLAVSSDPAGNVEAMEPANAETVVVNTVENGALTLDIAAGSNVTATFPMETGLNITITFGMVTTGGTVTVERLEGAANAASLGLDPDFLAGQVCVLTAGGGLDFADATVSFDIDESLFGPSLAAIDRAYANRGGTVEEITGARVTVTSGNVTITGIDTFSEWYFGTASSSVADWMILGR